METALMSRFHAELPDHDAGPPPEVQLEIEAAWERVQMLFDEGVEIDFEVDPVRRRAFASVVEPDGSRRRISSRHAVLVACGDAVVARHVPVAV
jgi:hypothetical protein